MAKVTRTPGPAADPLKKALATIAGTVGKVGWFASAHYGTGEPVAYIAAIHEFGSPENNIPPRLGMRATATEKRPEWASVAARGAKAVLAGKMSAPQLMEAIGLKAAGDIRKHIAQVRSPPLKVDTVKARLRGKKQGKVVSITAAKPLVDTGHLLATLSNTVEGKSEK